MQTVGGLLGVAGGVELSLRLSLLGLVSPEAQGLSGVDAVLLAWLVGAREVSLGWTPALVQRNR